MLAQRNRKMEELNLYCTCKKCDDFDRQIEKTWSLLLEFQQSRNITHTERV